MYGRVMEQQNEPPNLFEDAPVRADDDPLLQMFAVASVDKPDGRQRGTAGSRLGRTMDGRPRRSPTRILVRRTAVVLGGGLAVMVGASLALGRPDDQPSARKPEPTAPSPQASPPAAGPDRAAATNRARPSDASYRRSSSKTETRKRSRKRKPERRGTDRGGRPATSQRQASSPAPAPQPVVTPTAAPSQASSPAPSTAQAPGSAPAKSRKPKRCEYPPC